MASDVAPMALLVDLLKAAERAMALEDVPEHTRRRVINRLVYGHPDGAQARVEVEQARLQVQIGQQLEQGTEAMRIVNEGLRRQQMRQL
jgi:hypothetical protein